MYGAIHIQYAISATSVLQSTNNFDNQICDVSIKLNII